MSKLFAIFQDKNGATSVEYGLILAFVFLAMMVGVTAFGQQASLMWTTVAEEVDEAR